MYTEQWGYCQTCLYLLFLRRLRKPPGTSKKSWKIIVNKRSTFGGTSNRHRYAYHGSLSCPLPSDYSPKRLTVDRRHVRPVSYFQMFWIVLGGWCRYGHSGSGDQYGRSCERGDKRSESLATRFVNLVVWCHIGSTPPIHP